MTEKTEKKIEAKPTKAIAGLQVGRIVHYWKEKHLSNGNKVLKPSAAIIAQIAEGNFKPEDGAVDLVVFISHGGSMQNAHSVLYSEKPTAGRWSFPEKV